MTSAEQRVWTMPTARVTREQADEVGRIALKAGERGVRFLAATARYGAGVLRGVARAFEAVPPALRRLIFMGVIVLSGIVGAIALHGPFSVVCIVAVVPVSSIAVGVLGQRWYGASAAPASDLHRSVEYVDKKLTLALNSFGAERHQHAMIALFQAKTAVELTLGTEQDATSHVEALLSLDDHNNRPRIRAGLAAS